jgi:hypothetical protein
LFPPLLKFKKGLSYGSDILYGLLTTKNIILGFQSKKIIGETPPPLFLTFMNILLFKTPEGVVVGFRNIAWALSNPKK